MGDEQVAVAIAVQVTDLDVGGVLEAEPERVAGLDNRGLHVGISIRVRGPGIAIDQDLPPQGSIHVVPIEHHQILVSVAVEVTERRRFVELESDPT